MKRKLIAFDIDGTLLNSQSNLLESTLEVIEKLKSEGHLVTIATGRNLVTAKEVIKEVGLSNYVLCNGGYAFLDHQQVFSQPIDKEELKKLVAMANAAQFDLLYQTMTEVKQQGPFIHERNARLQEAFYSEPPSYAFDIDQEEAIYQAILFCNREEEKHFEGKFKRIRFTRWGGDAMDAVPTNSSKAVTLEAIATSQGIAKADMIVFGDGENDIEMLSLAGVGVAMGNASDYVKSFANVVTKSHDEDGIWHAARELKLI